MSKPDITFVIPAYNAEKTLEECIRSLKAQTLESWEAVIVDDGSRDRTLEIARAIASGDDRIKVHTQPNAGASSARNKAVSEATADYICMIDSDDWIEPDYLESMLPVAQKGNGKVIAYCSFQYATPEGVPYKSVWARDLTGDAARFVTVEECPIAIHCAVIPRAAYIEVGGLNTSLATCEDWELWIKLAYHGLEYKEVRKQLAYYRQHPGTLTGNPYNLVRDAIEVIRTARELVKRDFGDDPGAPDCGPDRETRIAAWFAGVFALRDVDPDALFKAVSPVFDFRSAEKFAGELIVGGLIEGGLGKSKSDLIREKAKWLPVLEKLLDILERASSLPGLKRQLWVEIARKLQYRSDVAEPWQLAHVLVVPLEMSKIGTIRKPVDADVAIIELLNRGVHAGTQEVPLYGDLSPSDIRNILARHVHPKSWAWMRNPALYRPLAEALVRKRRLLGHYLLKSKHKKQRFRDFFTEVVLDLPDVRRGGNNDEAIRLILENARKGIEKFVETDMKPGHAHEASVSGTDELDQAYWEKFYETEDPWDYQSAYETTKYRQTLELIPAGITNALEIGCSEGMFTKELCKRVTNLIAADISRTAVERAQKRCHGAGNIAFRQFDMSKDPLPPGQDLIVCSEILYYLRDEAELRDVAAKIVGALNPGGVLVSAHPHLLVDEPDHTGFDWSEPFGVKTITDVFSAIEGFAVEETIETGIYAVHRFRKVAEGLVEASPIIRNDEYGTPLSPAITRHLVPGGIATSREEAWKTESTRTVPVLMYHRVATDAPEGLRDYQVTPEAFEQQMLFLRREGYYGVTSSWLSKNMRAGRAFQGRPIVITFDDGYVDFAEYAYPILEHFGFTAEMFLVAERIGETSSWDSRYGTPAPLMDWNTLAGLSSDVVRFGSHLSTHRPASSLTSDELLMEAARSKAIIEKNLGIEVNSIALPYGDYDGRVPQILRTAGYKIAYSTDFGYAEPHHSLMRIPRINIGQQVDFDVFVKLVRRQG